MGVKTTGIYCRPSCPTPVPPKPKNMDFYASSAAAQRAGFRACKRCRPDASPGSPEWNTRADLVGRAMRLIADGAVDRDGVGGLARRLSLSERHLSRILVDELGAGPLALARAQRAQTARTLIETTTMPFGEVALAAGFRSVRQFNETITQVFAVAPRDLRRARQEMPDALLPASGMTVRLPFRTPYRADEILNFLGTRALEGVEAWNGTTYSRTLRLPRGGGAVHLTAAPDHFVCQLRLDDVADLQTAIQRCRGLLDLDADPVAIDTTLASEPTLAPLVRARPGLRVPGTVDGTEILVRAVAGQQVSVAGARTVVGAIVRAVGEPYGPTDDPLTYVFPSAEAVADAPDAALSMPVARRVALREACRRVARGDIPLDVGADRDSVRASLTDVKGIGSWTAEYVAMRASRDPDAFPASDLGIKNALIALGGSGDTKAVTALAEKWRPWRAYATHHLWSSLGER